MQAFTTQQDDSLPLAAFAAWRTLAFVVFRSGELSKRMALLLQPVKHALLNTTVSRPLLEARTASLPVSRCWISAPAHTHGELYRTTESAGNITRCSGCSQQCSLCC